MHDMHSHAGHAHAPSLLRQERRLLQATSDNSSYDSYACDAMDGDGGGDGGCDATPWIVRRVHPSTVEELTPQPYTPLNHTAP